jgi:hypothetical protein
VTAQIERPGEWSDGSQENVFEQGAWRILDPQPLHSDLAEIERTNHMTQEIDASFADLDKRHTEVGAAQSQGHAGKSRSTTQIDDLGALGEVIGGRQRVFDVATQRVGLGGAHQIRVGAPTGQLVEI